MLVRANILPQVVDLKLCSQIYNFYMQIFLIKMQIINFSFWSIQHFLEVPFLALCGLSLCLFYRNYFIYLATSSLQDPMFVVSVNKMWVFFPHNC